MFSLHCAFVQDYVFNILNCALVQFTLTAVQRSFRIWLYIFDFWVYPANKIDPYRMRSHHYLPYAVNKPLIFFLFILSQAFRLFGDHTNCQEFCDCSLTFPVCNWDCVGQLNDMTLNCTCFCFWLEKKHICISWRTGRILHFDCPTFSWQANLRKFLPPIPRGISIVTRAGSFHQR